MSDFKDRLKIEKSELDERIVKLRDFCESDRFPLMSENNQALLSVQLKIMESYSEILFRRLMLAV